MVFHEVGPADAPVVVLLHGGGLGAWSWDEIVPGLGANHHLLIPDIEGHGEAADEDFESIADSARALIAQIDRQFSGRVFALAGLSLGAQIALEALAQRPELAECALIESAQTQPSPRMARMAVPLCRRSYRLIGRRWFSKLQARSMGLPDRLWEAYYRDSRRISLRSLIHTLVASQTCLAGAGLRQLPARVLVLAGRRESGAMRASARELAGMLPQARLFLLPGMRHGELSLKQPEKWLSLFHGLESGLYFKKTTNNG